jgi:hypothetical protein
MRFNIPLIDKLARATPRKNILQWVFITMIYGFAIIVNDHFDLVRAIGLPKQSEAVVRLCGVYLYIVLTAYSFHKTKKDENNTDHTKVAADMAHHDKPDRVPAAPGTKGHSQRHRSYGKQSKSVPPATRDTTTARADGTRP